MENMFNLDYKFGEPLIQCLPFAQVVIKNQKKNYCDYCLKKYAFNLNLTYNYLSFFLI